MTSSSSDVEVALSESSKKSAREVSCISARAWYIVDMVKRGAGAAVERVLALRCAVAIQSGSL